MKLVSYHCGAGLAGGILLGEAVVDLAAAVRQADGDRAVPPDGRLGVRQVLAAGWATPDLVASAAALVAAGRALPRAEVQLGPPIPDPDKILCIGLNFRDHAAESNLPLPPLPLVFAKFRNSLVGPFDPVGYPDVSNKIDYEGELAVVIGRRAKRVSQDDALHYVAGAMVLNDLTARDLQKATSQWTLGKAVDAFAPCGPALVTLDEIGSLDDLVITSRVNGAVMQHGSTADMIFDVPYLVAHLSRAMTLEPGDIIATGTPAGVGAHRTPPVFLTPGDTVEISIDRVGALANVLVAPPSEEDT